MEWEYIGDGVYIAYDGFHVWLTLQPNFNKDYAIALEPDVLKSVNDFYKKKSTEEN